MICNLKLPWNYIKWLHFILRSYEEECPSLSSFLYCLQKTLKLFNKCVICYLHDLKSILNDDLFKECVNLVVIINYKLYNIIKKVYLFQLVAFKICAVVKTVHCFNWLSWTSTFKSETLTQKLFTSWVQRKNQCRSAVRKHALLWNKR